MNKNQNQYILSPSLEVFITLAQKRMESGRGVVLLLEGPPGGGKTSFAKELARRLGGPLFFYSCAPDRERDLLYEIDVRGVLRRENAWVPGAAWQAFKASHAGPVVLLIDEVDKAHPGFDAFLLRLLEEFSFRSPEGDTISASAENCVVVLTTNGRRELRPEVLRRCQRLYLPLPDKARMKEIVLAIAKQEIPAGLLDLVVRLGMKLQSEDPEMAPSPKELAYLALDILALQGQQVEAKIVEEVASSWLFKSREQRESFNPGFNWVKALKAEGGIW